MNFINTLKEGAKVVGVYYCTEKRLAQTRTGNYYYDLKLRDKTGTISCKIWNTTGAGVEDFEANSFVVISGVATMFKNELQLNISAIQYAEQGSYCSEDYFPVTTKDVDLMLAEIQSLALEVTDKDLRYLLEHFFAEDMTFLTEFAQSSGAKSVHHNFVGGLMEHTLSVATLCKFFAEHYGDCNKDLVITAALLHDIGKTKELVNFPENTYTDDGYLIGHVVMSYHMVADYIDTKSDFNKDTARHLLHCILAHHGQLEFGSPKVPATKEAILLHYADNLDAKVAIADKALAENSGNKFVYDKYLNTYVTKM